MIDLRAGVNSLVTAFRAIPELQTAMGHDASLIKAYHDFYPAASSVNRALLDLGSPGMLVFYRGSLPGDLGRMETYKHWFGVFARAKIEDLPPPEGPAGYYAILKAIVDGIPAINGNTQTMRNFAPIDGCYSMDPPQWERKTDSGGLDYFEINLKFPQWGDLT